jgi:pimeloyl-ACP methyl ester carboxylesterase
MAKRIDFAAFSGFVQRRKKTVVVGWLILSLLILSPVLLPLVETGSLAEIQGSHYVRANEDKGVIVFVHGVLGDAKTTWTNPVTKAYWPDLIKGDPKFNGYNIYAYGFPTPLTERSYSVDELADNMHLILEQSDVLAHKELIFLAHSMGGLITRALLLKYRDIIPKVRFIYFFSTPTTGSETANIANLVSRNPQFRNMFPMGDNTYIESLQSSWLAARIPVRSFCAYEKLETYGIDVVTRQSATNLCTEPLTPILADHISIVKPESQTDLPYVAFAAAFDATKGR